MAFPCWSRGVGLQRNSALTVGHTFEAESAQEARAMAMRPKVNARNLAYVILFWLSAVASLALASDDPQLTVIISFHVTVCILHLLVRRASLRTISRRGAVYRARMVGRRRVPNHRRRTSNSRSRHRHRPETWNSRKRNCLTQGRATATRWFRRVGSRSDSKVEVDFVVTGC